MVKELPNTVVHCKTPEEYDQLLSTPIAKLFESRHIYCPGWTHVPCFRHIWDLRPDNEVIAKEYQVISLFDFLRIQGLDTLKPGDLKPGDWVEVVEGFKTNYGHSDGHNRQSFKAGEKCRIRWAGSSILMFDVDRPDDPWGYTFISEELSPHFRSYSPTEPKIEWKTKTFTDWNGKERTIRYKSGSPSEGEDYCSEPPKQAPIPFWKRGMPLARMIVQRGLDDDSQVKAHYGKGIGELKEDLYALTEAITGVKISEILSPTSAYCTFSTSSPSPRMSVSNFFRNTALSAEERVLRKANIKDTCGKLTCEGKELLLAFLADQNKTELAKFAKKFLKAQKSQDEDDAE